MDIDRKTLLLWLGLIILVLLCFELLGFLAWSISEGRVVPPRTIQALLKDASGGREDERGKMKEEKEGENSFRIIHPFVGYEKPDNPLEIADLSTELSSALCVLILGGSVAEQLKDEQERMRQALQQKLDRNVTIHNFAIGGYKQPQQMHMLLHLLAFGKTCDVVVNVDGFNEYDLVFDNAEDGVNPWYPYKRMWSLPVAGLRDIPSQAVAYEMLQLQDAQFQSAQRLRHSLFGRSYLVTFFWRTWDTRTDKKIHTLRERISEFGNSEAKSLAADGPPFDDDPDVLIKQSVDLWAESSRLMHAAATAHGITYIHVLQPNQYVPGSKRVISDKERRITMTDERHTEIIPQMYPLMQEAGKSLQEDGVQFYDLTSVFLDEPGQTYRDLDTHVSPLGNRKLTDGIVDVIVQSL